MVHGPDVTDWVTPNERRHRRYPLSHFVAKSADFTPSKFLNGIQTMASYKYSAYVVQNDSGEFDKLHNPGSLAPHSGIYRCEACGYEAACNEGQSLPPQNVHPHPAAVKWRLAVYAVHKH